MKTKIYLLLIVSLSWFCMAAESSTDGMLFHFDYAKKSQPRDIADATGKYHCLATGYDFYIEQGGLRIAPEAQFSIPMPQKANGKTMSFCTWLVADGKTDNVIFFKGVHPYSIEYALMLDRTKPVFCYKNQPGQDFWKGVYCVHRKHAYPTEQWLEPGARHDIVPESWTHLAYTFDRGNIRIYIDGKLAVNMKSEKPELLKCNTLPGYVGADRVYKAKGNYTTANLLLNDMRLYSRVLSAKDVAAIYNTERQKYATGRVPLKDCLAYLDKSVKAFDPEYDIKLPIASEYEERNRTNPPKVAPVESVEQRLSHGKVGLFINSQQVYPMVAIPGIPTYITPKQRMGCLQDFAAAGVNLLSSGYLSMVRFWNDIDQYNWNYVDNLLQEQLKAAPDGRIMVYLFINVPEWYFDKHPDEHEQYYAGGKLNTITYRGPISPKNVLKAEVKLAHDLVGHIEKSPYGKHVYAYLVGGAGAAEWYWPAHWEGITGYSPATQCAFRQWLKEAYKNDLAAFRKAWNNPKITFETAMVPLPAERAKTGFFCFRNPAENRPSMDLDQFMNDKTYQMIEALCKATKEASQFKKLVLTYNGYCLLYHGKTNPHNTALRRFTRVIDCPYIDGFATPMDYDQRRAGEPSMNINPFYASAKLRGKSIWKEDDLRTHFLKKGLGRTANLQETLEVIRHCFGNSLTTGGGFWFYSLNHPALFHQEDIMRTVAQLKKLAVDSMTADVSSTAEVALIVDEDASYYLANRADNYLIRHAWGTYLAAARMGAPFDTYLVGDLANPKMPDYKLYIFLNCYHADKKQAEFIARKIRRNNAVSVWCYAPGFFSENGMGTTRMKELTGMDFTVVNKQELQGFNLSKNSPITRYFTLQDPFTVGPVFVPSGKNLKVLGTANGRTALATLEFPTWRSVYTSIPLNCELLMGLCDYAGVHVYSRSYDVFNGNSSFLLLHTSTEGNKTIQLNGKYTVKELFSGKILGEGISVVHDKVPAKTTRIYQLTK